MLPVEQIKVFIFLYVYIRNLFTDFFFFIQYLRSNVQISHFLLYKIASCTSVCFVFLGRTGKRSMVNTHILDEGGVQQGRRDSQGKSELRPLHQSGNQGDTLHSSNTTTS